MAERKAIPPELRQAIWEGNEKKCVYTSEVVTLDELQIDHLIPVDEGENLISELRRLNIIDGEFDLNGPENLIPTKSTTNRQKSNKKFDLSAVIYFLQIAKSNKNKVNSIYESLVNGTVKINGYLNIKNQARKNDISTEEMFSYFLHQYEGKVPLRSGLGMSGRDIQAANSVIADSLMDYPFALGGGAIKNVRMISDDGDEVVCENAREFISAKEEKKFYPVTQFDMNCYGLADNASEPLNQIKKSRWAKKSFIRDPLIRLVHLDKLHASWSEGIFFQRRELLNYEEMPTIQDMVDNGICDVEIHDNWSVTIFDIDHGMGVGIHEFFRADLDEDDYEEILLFYSVFATGGTYRFGRVVMGKPNENGIIYEMEFS
ncbi:hypothetical protein [uncultured Nisaea sp.]|uniref:hypothetical protein n=1 Tax=uncultured Nisaea sp. TaxID=538215 RepID=UPI0030ECD65F